MKTLYEEDNFDYTEDCLNLGNKISSSLKEVFSEYVKLGYSPREIAHVIITETFYISIEIVARMKRKIL